MSGILLYYEKVNPTTWVYLSSLLMIALYFKFGRLWSVRNLDLIGLILLAPGLLFVIYGQETHQPAYQQVGYAWLFSIGGLFLIRMLIDPMMVRRPLLEPNLTVGGMTFLGLSLFLFLMANVATDTPARRAAAAADTAIAAAPAPTTSSRGDSQDNAPAASNRNDAQETQPPPEQATPAARASESPEHPPAEAPLMLYGPGYPWVFEIFKFPARFLFERDTKPQIGASDDLDPQRLLRLATARTVAVFSYLAVVIGLVVIGYRHFDNIKTGIAAAVLYLLLPYTAILTGRYLAVQAGTESSSSIGQVYHVLLAALLVWAFAAYRRPLISGILLGLAIGMFYYPIFLLPLWCSFYWQRGVLRFAAGVIAMLVMLVAILYFHPYGSFTADLRQMFGWILPRVEHLQGFWGLPFNDPIYRIPVLAAFVVMC